MTSTEKRGISSSRVSDTSGVDVAHLECIICHDVLWKPVACQSCETPFCSACINQWLAYNPNKCPNRCETYTERKCPPFVAKLLAQLQITCFYQSNGCQQVLSYEALDKHEKECGYQYQQCPGCRSEILKKDFDNHKKNCALIELICQDCKLMYRRGDAATKHTENTCLREQLRQLRDESKENKRIIRELTYQFNEIRIWKYRMSQEVTINFSDLLGGLEKERVVPSMYRGLIWTGFSYAHELFLKKNYPNSGYMTSFMSGGSSHVAFFNEEALIDCQHSNETFTLISLTACAAWNDDLKITITGHRNSIETKMHTTTLLFGQPQLILLHWKDIDNVTFEPSGGIAHPGTGTSALPYVVVTQLTIGSLD